MELREPPRRPPPPAPADRLVRWLLLAQTAALLAAGAVLWYRGAAPGPRPDAARDREVAARLQAAGALDEAAARLERYLEAGGGDGEEGARLAYGLGSLYLAAGRHERALRWFYEAEVLGPGDLGEELGRKVVHTLERLGRFQAAQAALDRRVALPGAAAPAGDDDPVVARIGTVEIPRSEVLRALDELPPALASGFEGAEGRAGFLRKYVADELLWRKARKREYDSDPEVLRRHAQALRELAIAELLERDLVAGIEVDETAVRDFFAAHADRYRVSLPGDGGERRLSFEEARPAVERDYRRRALETAYGELIEAELAAQAVELFPERMGDGR